ncbi:MAG: endonuclease III [Candidatus Woesearchaeota archaeon]
MLGLLKKEYPFVKPSLNYENPFQLLVATILSAQCTDKRVNIVTKSLFRKYTCPEDLADSKLNDLEQEIKSTGFYKNKAKNIKKASKMIIKEFDGTVPDSMDELTKLPGVARKTANIVLYHGFGKISGIAVDTHVKRLSFRLGLTKNTDSQKIEKDLMKVIPKKEWGNITDLLIYHGRAVCKAQKPDCAGCVLNKICPSAFKF